ncbi:retrovirus-related pol polyprotein from transposon TNT 1-94 [Tanacetum coccineum]
MNNDIERLRAKNRDLKEKYDIALQLGNVVESLRQENAFVRQDLMWVMRTGIPLMINKVIRSEEFNEGMLKVLEHFLSYGRQLGQCDVHDGFAADTSNIEPPCSDFSLPQNVMDSYTMFRSTTVKGHILAYFMVESTINGVLDVTSSIPQRPTDLTSHTWTLYTDGASNNDRSRASLILTNLQGNEVTYALRFDFPTSNYEAEYEALIAGLELATRLEADTLSKLASSSFAHLTKNVLVEVKPYRSIDVKEVLSIIDMGTTWMDPIVEYLKDRKIPADPAEYVLQEAHFGSCGSYSRARTLTQIAARLALVISTELIASCVAARYNISSSLGVGTPLSVSNKGKDLSAERARKRPRAANLPFILCTSVIVHGYTMSIMALTFWGFASIPSLFSISSEETIDSGFTRFNAIVTSLKSLDQDYSGKNRVSFFQEHQGKVKLLALKAKVIREQTSDDSDSQEGSDEYVDEEEAEACNLIARNFRNGIGFGNKGGEISRQRRGCYNYGKEGHFIGECPKPKENKAFLRRAWSDSEDGDEPQNDATCLMAIDSQEVQPKPSISNNDLDIIDLQMENEELLRFNNDLTKTFEKNLKEKRSLESEKSKLLSKINDLKFEVKKLANNKEVVEP